MGWNWRHATALSARASAHLVSPLKHAVSASWLWLRQPVSRTHHGKTICIFVVVAILGLEPKASVCWLRGTTLALDHSVFPHLFIYLFIPF